MLTLGTLAVALIHTTSLAHGYHHFWFPPPPPPAPVVHVAPPPPPPVVMVAPSPPPPAVWVAPPPPPPPASLTGPGQHPVSLTLSLGSRTGEDTVSGERNTAFAYGARLGLRLVDGLMLTGEYAGAAPSPECRPTAGPLGTATAGLQWFLLPFFYLRGAGGAAFVGHDSPDAGTYAAAVAAAGLDIPVGSHLALNLEAAGTTARLCCSNWSALTLSVGMTLF